MVVHIMRSYLESLPSELFESISSLLDLHDICSLRQSNSTLAARCLHGRLFSYFSSKRIELREDKLRAFVQMTQPGWLGCVMSHLTLVGVVIDTTDLKSVVNSDKQYRRLRAENNQPQTECEQLYKVGTKDEESMRPIAQHNLDILRRRRKECRAIYKSGLAVKLLSEALRNIATNSPTGNLHSLSLEAVFYRDSAAKKLEPQDCRRWERIWQSTAATFHTALRSLAASRLPIEKLNIFNDRQLKQCSLARNELGTVDFENEGLAISLASLKSLSISTSGTFVYRCPTFARGSGDSTVDDDADGPDPEHESSFNGLAKLIKLSNNFEDLEIQYYRLWGNSGIYLERMLQRVAELDTLPKLKRIELRAFEVREQDLLALVRSGVRKLFIYDTKMTTGTFGSVFDYCSSDAADMEQLCFHNLQEEGGFVCFASPGLPPPPPIYYRGEGAGGTSHLEKVGVEVKQPIVYTAVRCANPRREIVGANRDAQARRRLRRREYGPPRDG